jgi:ATP-dependent protease Clp ATPase subunit
VTTPWKRSRNSQWSARWVPRPGMILEDLMLDLMYYLPTYKKVREFAVTKEMVLSQKINVTLLEKAG